MTFTETGPVFAGANNKPRRVSDFDEGFTLEFWFYLLQKPTIAPFKLQLFELTNIDGTVELYFDETESALNTNFFTVPHAFTGF